ncbi:MAG: alpha/beta hydrolase [Bacteroidota bacterium]
MIIIGAIIISVFLLYVFVPKGFVLYEGMRFPAWTFKMKQYPSNGLRPDKHVYGYHERQYLIHYRPQEGNGNKKQVVVYIHGGGWQFGNPEMFRPNAQILNTMGYHSFFLSHRRIPKHNILSMKADIAKGMGKVKEIMQGEGIAGKQVILGGVSSGANLAALFYFDRTMLESAGYSIEHIAGLFLMAPPLNLKGMWPSPTLRWLAGKRSGDLFEKANPISYLNDKEEVPTLIVAPEKDGMVPLKSTKIFVEKAKEVGFENLEFHILESMTHMDAASWCFTEHPSHEIVVKWLKQI